MDAYFTTYILPVLLGFLGAMPAILIFIYNVLRLREERNKLISDTDNIKAKTVAEFEQVARNAAQNVISKDARIEGLERAVDELRGRLRAMEDERDILVDQIKELQRQVELLQQQKQALERENIDLVEKMNLLRAANSKLEERVRKLEAELRKNDIPLPNGG